MSGSRRKRLASRVVRNSSLMQWAKSWSASQGYHPRAWPPDDDPPPDQSHEKGRYPQVLVQFFHAVLPPVEPSVSTKGVRRKRTGEFDDNAPW
jgi:hypothetical protein